MEQPSLALEAQFVDREKELGTLKALFEQMVSGKGCTVFVVGEAGIGKTRLVRELRRLAESRGAIFSQGASYEQEGMVPYSPWLDVLRSLLKGIPADKFRKISEWILAEVGGLVPEIMIEAKEMGLKAWLQGPKTSSIIVPATDQERIRLFQAITYFLTTATSERGAVVFLDDISWADNASLQLFHYVARRTAEQKLMLIGAYRDVELPDDHPLVRVTLDLSRQRIAHQIGLTRFTPEYVSQLLANHFRGPVSPEFSQLVFSKTGGNPFFVEEIARSLIDQGLLERSDKGWSVKDIQQVEIPSSIRVLIKQRVSRLGEQFTQFLSIASVIGMEFDFEILKRVAGFPEEVSLNLLETALRAQLIRERKEQGKVVYVFADEQIRGFLSGQLSLLRKRKYHILIGNAMQGVYEQEVEAHLGEMAYHFVEGAETTKAKEYSIKAGERAARLYAHSEAMRHFLNAMELLGEHELETRLALLTRLGQSAWGRGDHKEVVKFCGEAIEIGERTGLKKKVVDLYGLLGVSYWFLGNSKKDALASYLKGLEVLEDIEDTVQEAVLCQQIARVYVLTGEPALSTDWVKRSIEIALKLEAHEVLAQAYQTLALGLPVKEKESIFSYLNDALNLALKHRLEDPACRAYNNLASLYYSSLKGDYRQAVDIWLQGIEYSRKAGQLQYETWLQTELISGGYLPMGEWEKCQKVALQTIAIGRELGELYLIRPYTALAYISAAREEVQKAKEFLNESLPLSLKSEWPELLILAYQAAAATSLAEDNLDEAERNLLRAFEARTKAVAPSFPLLEVAFGLVAVSLKKRRLDNASRYYQDLHQMASELDERWGWAFELWAEGLIAEARGEIENAVRALTESVELWKGLQRPYELGRAHLDLGRVLEKTGKKAEAEQNFDATRKIFEKLEIPWKF